MELPGLLWPLIIVFVVALFALFGLILHSLSRLRDLGDSVRATGRDLSEGLQKSEISGLERAQEQMERLGQRLQTMQSALDERLTGQQKLLADQLSASGRTVADLKKELGSLSEATGQIFELGRNIAGLESILTSPKLRGGVGEIFLEKLLADTFPGDFYEIQYSFSSGVMVDAVLRIGGQLVPIDSKFPIEDFRRVLEADESERPKARRRFLANVKKKIDDIASRYIVPDEGTFDFAMMYIPAENVYYETILRDDGSGGDAESDCLLEYAVNRHVIPVSPNSFYAYLQVILYGLRGLELERRGSEIMARLRRMQGELDAFSEEYARLGTHLANAGKAYDRAERKLSGLDIRLHALEDTSGASSHEAGTQLPEEAGGNDHDP